MGRKLRVHVEHVFKPDHQAVRRAITLLLRMSEEVRAAERADGQSDEEVSA